MDFTCRCPRLNCLPWRTSTRFWASSAHRGTARITRWPSRRHYWDKYLEDMICSRTRQTRLGTQSVRTTRTTSAPSVTGTRPARTASAVISPRRRSCRPGTRPPRFTPPPRRTCPPARACILIVPCRSGRSRAGIIRAKFSPPHIRVPPDTASETCFPGRWQNVQQPW